MILLVEDNTDDAELIRYAFAKAEIADPVVTIGDGVTAIAYVEGAGVYADRENHPHPSLVLLDLRLPRRSGYEVLRAIRGTEPMRHTPVVVLTSSTQEADIRRAYDAGASSYLVKPVSRDTLLEMVKSLTYTGTNSTEQSHNEPAMKVLIVDDVANDRKLVTREVEALYPDAKIVELGGRDEFEAAFADGPFDLVVTDLALGWGSGREVFERVKAARPDCPVVMFTGSGDETTAADLMKAGLDDYVVKSARQLPRLRTSIKVSVEALRVRSALSEREVQLTAALAHKETIVRELHHRVKNNLQTITSLLQLRANTSNPEVAEQLDELAGRMRALSAVQLRIYETERFDRVDFRAVLSDIAESLSKIYDAGHIALVRDFDGPLELDSERAMPLALLCYELILNALKHAWPGRQPGRLVVALRTAGELAELSITDDGVGFIDADVTKGLGSRLVRGLSGEARVEISTLSHPGDGSVVTLRLV